MVVDTSSIVAVIRQEPDHQRHEDAIEAAPICRISVATYLECVMTLTGDDKDYMVTVLDQFLFENQISVEPVSSADGALASSAFLRYGRGRHRAKLNFGDCLSYALAKRVNEPLLFKGNDFVETDVLKA